MIIFLLGEEVEGTVLPYFSFCFNAAYLFPLCVCPSFKLYNVQKLCFDLDLF